MVVLSDTDLVGNVVFVGVCVITAFSDGEFERVADVMGLMERVVLGVFRDDDGDAVPRLRDGADLDVDAMSVPDTAVFVSSTVGLLDEVGVSAGGGVMLLVVVAVYAGVWVTVLRGELVGFSRTLVVASPPDCDGVADRPTALGEALLESPEILWLCE
jgi:hypothetical protein